MNFAFYLYILYDLFIGKCISKLLSHEWLILDIIKDIIINFKLIV